MHTKDNYTRKYFHQLNEMRNESEKNSSRIYSDNIGHSPVNKLDYVSKTEVHPDQKDLIVQIILAALSGILLAIALVVLINVFEG